MIEIPLSKHGKHKGKYVAIVSDEDKDLAELNWAFICGYAGRGQNGKSRMMLHRVIIERLNPDGIFENQQVDHINRNKLDNRRENLRIATHSQNHANTGIRKDNSSGYKGVHWNKQSQKWVAQIKINKKTKRIGAYDTPEEAYKAYCAKAKELFGEFSNTP